MNGFKRQEKIMVRFFATETTDLKQAEMYVEVFKTKLKKNTSYKGLWIMNVTLKEY